MIDYEDDEQNEEEEIRQRVNKLISSMEDFSKDLAIEAHIRPYINPYFPDMAHEAVVLTDLFADEPGSGVGSKYIAELKRQCDKNLLTLYTDAQGPESCRFYLKRGFSLVKPRGHHQLVYCPPFDFENNMDGPGI